MAISALVERVLIASSGGRCARPACIAPLLVVLDDGSIATVMQRSHIIAQSPSGPRSCSKALRGVLTGSSLPADVVLLSIADEAALGFVERERCVLV